MVSTTYRSPAWNSQLGQINENVHVTSLNTKTIDRGSKLVHCHPYAKTKLTQMLDHNR